MSIDVIIKNLLDRAILFSLFAFSKEVLDYDLAAFFDRNSEVIKSEVYGTLEILLRAD